RATRANSDQRSPIARAELGSLVAPGPGASTRQPPGLGRDVAPRCRTEGAARRSDEPGLAALSLVLVLEGTRERVLDREHIRLLPRGVHLHLAAEVAQLDDAVDG